MVQKGLKEVGYSDVYKRQGQEYGNGFVLRHLVSVERVLAHPFFGQGHVCNTLEAFHITDNGVPAKAGFRF